MAISFVNSVATSGSDSSAETSWPTNTATDDIVVCFVIMSQAGTISAFTWPSGWTAVSGTAASMDQGTISGRVEIRWHKYTSGDTAPTITLPSTPTSGGWRTVMHTYRGVDGTTPISGSNSVADATYAAASATKTTPTVTAGTSVWRLWAFCSTDVGSSQSWGSYSPADTERRDGNAGAITYSHCIATGDSNANIDSSGGTSITGTTAANDTYSRYAALMLLAPSQNIQPAPSPTVLQAAALELSTTF